MKRLVVLFVIAIVATQSTKADAQLLPGENTPSWIYAVGAGSVTLAGVLFFKYKRSKIPKIDPFEKVRQVTYIATKQEVKQTKYVTSKQEVENYLQAFWKRRDPSPGTETNETRDEFERRIDYANEHFGGTLAKGWRSHRGRIHIIYGLPDEIERLPSSGFSLDGKTIFTALEMWLYHRPEQVTRESIFDSVELGKVKFVFGDKDGYGEYSQIYSSVPGEISDPRVFSLASARFR